MSRRGIIGSLSVAAVAGLIIWASMRGGDGKKEQEEDEPSTKAPTRISRTAEGDPLLKLDPATQSRAGLRIQILPGHTLQPKIVAYGRLEEDPAYSFVLRAPIAGFLHAGGGGTWPAIGDRLSPGAVIGTIEPRFAPTERISLANQLTMARSELNASTTAVATARAAYERARILNADNKNVSDRVLQEAESRLKEQEERLKAAKESVQLLEDSLRSAGPAGTRSLVAERGGEVVELTAQPGEAIEPGSPILRITRLDRLLARIEVPAGQRVPPDIATARVVATGFEDQPIRATQAALAPLADPQSQGQSFYFRLPAARFGLRPGHAVTAYLELPGSPRRGVVIPRSALVRVAGRTYAYVQISNDQFVRKEVPVDDPVTDGYFTSVNFAPGDKIAIVGAQTLLSEEFKSQIAVEEDK